MFYLVDVPVCMGNKKQGNTSTKYQYIQFILINNNSNYTNKKEKGPLQHLVEGVSTTAAGS